MRLATPRKQVARRVSSGHLLRFYFQVGCGPPHLSEECGRYLIRLTQRVFVNFVRRKATQLRM